MCSVSWEVHIGLYGRLNDEIIWFKIILQWESAKSLSFILQNSAENIQAVRILLITDHHNTSENRK